MQLWTIIIELQETGVPINEITVQVGSEAKSYRLLFSGTTLNQNESLQIKSSQMLVFRWKGKTGVPGEKPLKAE